MVEEQPWDNEIAARYIHQLARADVLRLTKIPHAEERMLERGILARDVLYVMKHGEVVGAARPSTREGLFKYRIQSKTPNSDGEIIGIVVIPCLEQIHIIMVTAMWVGNKAVGTVIESE